jgi:hypothetical protein
VDDAAVSAAGVVAELQAASAAIAATMHDEHRTGDMRMVVPRVRPRAGDASSALAPRAVNA